MKQKRLFTPQPALAAHPGEPPLWFERLTVLRSRNPAEQPIRDIAFRLGLNIVQVAEPEAPGGATDRTFGHNVGKTMLVRLLRYCLGDGFFADLAVRDRVRELLPDGWVIGVVRVRGITWSVARSLGRRVAGWCLETGDWRRLLGDTASLRPYGAFVEELNRLVPSDFANVKLDGPGRPPSWPDLLGWLVRDQRCRYTHHAAWRHADAESGIAALSLGDANLVARLTMGLFDGEENRQTTELATHRSDTQRVEVEVERERIAASLLREGLLTRGGLSDHVPDGPLFVEALRSGFRDQKERQERRLDEQPDRRVWRQAEEDLAAIRSLSDRAAGRREELQRRKNRLSPTGDPSLVAAALSCGLEGCLHLRPGGSGKPDPLREETAALEGEIARAATEIETQEKAIREATTRRDEARSKYEKAAGEVRKAMAGQEAALDELIRYEKCQARIATLEEKLRSAPDRERDLERRREAPARGRDQAMADLNATFDEVTTALLRKSSGELVLNLRDGLAPRTDASSGEAFGTAGKVIGFDLACLLASALGRGRHPRFLVHDSPREADMHRAIYENLFLFVKGLEERFPGQPPAFQYIVTTTTPPPAEVGAAPYVRETLHAMTPEGLLLRVEL